MNVFELVASITFKSKEFTQGLENARQSANAAGTKIKNVFADVAKVATAAFTATTAAVTGFVAKSISSGQEFDKAMSGVAATLGKTVDEMNKDIQTVQLPSGEEFTGNLREFASKMGAETAFSATEAANALNYMALAGYDAKQSMEMLPNVLNLAAAGNMDLATASDMVTDAQTAFGISFDRASQMVDEMAKASSTGNTNVQQLGEAFLRVGALAQELNGGLVTLADGTVVETDNIQEMATAFVAMANSGVKSAEAGTHLRNMIMKLTSPTENGAKAFAEMGVSVFDADGKMRGLSAIFKDLNSALGQMSQADKIKTVTEIFNARDLASAEALLKAVEQDWDKIGASIQDADGAAQAMADTMLDNLAGDITIFDSALSGVYNTIEAKLDPALRGFVQIGTEGLSDLNKAIENGDFNEMGRIFETVFTNALNSANELLPSVLKIGGMLLKTIAKGIAQNVPFLLDSALDIVNRLLNSLNYAISRQNGNFGFIDSIINILKKQLPKTIYFVKRIIKNVSDSISENIPIIAKEATHIIKVFADTIITNLPLLFESSAKIVSALASEILDNLPALIDTALSFVTSFADFIVEKIPEIAPQILDFMIAFAEILTNPDTLLTLLDAATKIIVALADYLLSKEVLDQLLEKLPEIVDNIVTGIVGATGKLLDAATKIISKITGYLFNLENLNKITRAGIRILSVIADGIDKTMWKITDAIWNVAESIADTLGLKDYWEIGKQIIDDFMGGIKQTWNDYIDWWAGFWEYVDSGEAGGDFYSRQQAMKQSFLSEDTPFARGGIVTKPTRALIGEAGTEAVIPLEHNTEWINMLARKINGNSTSVTVKMPETINVSSDYDVKRMVDVMGEQIDRKLREIQSKNNRATGGVW